MTQMIEREASVLESSSSAITEKGNDPKARGQGRRRISTDKRASVARTDQQ